jgi:hypothetical protein
VSTFGTSIAAYVDENLALQGRDAGLLGGQMGLYSAGEAGAEFDDVRVQSTPNTSLITSRVAGSDAAWQERTFATDPYMESWGNASSEWEATGSSAFQSRGIFYQTLDVALNPSLLTTANGAPRLQEAVLFANAEKPNAGYKLLFEAGKITLTRDGKVLSSANVADTSGLSISVRRGRITVADEEKTLLTYTDRTPLSSGRVALNFRSAISPTEIANIVAVASSNMLEYRFDAAPVDWQIESGIWQSTTRWACVPNWNFYGGKGESTPHGEPIATVWNKRGFSGDGWIEAFVAPAEGTSDNMHFAYPVNMNFAFGATGDALGSGYNLIYRAQDATTLLLRQGKVVAESNDIVFPGLRDDEMTVYYRLTETWQHIQIQRVGARIRVWAEVPGPHKERIERKQIIDYIDSKPLTGDRVALWTYGINGMSVARLRIASSQIHAPYPAFQNSPVNSTLAAKPASTILQRKVNDINGGPFRIDLLKKPLPLSAMPSVRFDYRNTPNITLALYAKINNQLFRAEFLVRVEEDGDAIAVGAIKKSTLASGLQRAEFSLKNAVQEYFPQGGQQLEELFLADLSTTPQQVGGLSTNAKGTAFEWRMVLAPGAQQAVASTAPITKTSNAQSNERVDDFETSIGDWKRMDGEQGATLSRDKTTAASGKWSLRLYHRKLAGSFGAMAYDKPFDARRWPKLTFSYRLNERVQLSLVFESGGRWYEIGFTDRDHTWPVVGTIANVQKDNKWHVAEVDLLGAAQRANSNNTVITKVFFADTGITNNLQNVFWNIDDFRFVGATPDPSTAAQSTLVTIDVAPPVDKPLSEPVIEVRLKGAEQIDIETLTVRAKSGAITREYFPNDSNGALTFDGKQGILRWQDANLTKQQSQAYGVALELQANDLSGKPALNEKWNYTVDPSLDKTAPAAPYVSYKPTNRISLQDFESGISDDFGIRRATWILDDKSTSATGYGSARIVNLAARDFFSAFFKKSGYDVENYPMVAFDYRFESLTNWTSPRRRRNPEASASTSTSAPQYSPYNLNLVSIVNGDMQLIKLIGGLSRNPAFIDASIGEVRGVMADGEWHNASLDFGTLLRKRYPNSPRLYANYFGTWATGPWGYMNPQGVSLWVDNVTFYSTKADSAAFEWKAPSDTNGVGGYSFALDRKPDTIPDTTIDTQSTFREFKNLARGTWYFHLRACDGAGNWSETSHQQIELTR